MGKPTSLSIAFVERARGTIARPLDLLCLMWLLVGSAHTLQPPALLLDRPPAG
jgi:hypothetical protein